MSREGFYILYIKFSLEHYEAKLCTTFCLYFPGFQRQIFEHDKKLSERSKEMKEQKKNKRSVLVAEFAYNSQNRQFGLLMKS